MSNVPNIYVEVKYEQTSVKEPKLLGYFPPISISCNPNPFRFLSFCVSLQSRHKVVERRGTQLGGADEQSILKLLNRLLKWKGEMGEIYEVTNSRGILATRPRRRWLLRLPRRMTSSVSSVERVAMSSHLL
jgi:hypothetical protein